MIRYLLGRALLGAAALGLFTALLLANPPPSQWQIVTPSAAGQASGGDFFPLNRAFDGSPTWNTTTASVGGTAGLANAPAYSSRYGFIDFGSDFAQVHIMETWTLYRTFSGGSQPGYQTMWWDDDTDTINDNGITETRLDFNSAQGAPNLNAELWLRDKRVNDVGGVRPPRRYLILKSDPVQADRAREYAIVGYYYDGLVPPEYANLPRLSIDSNTVVENTAWSQIVGQLTISAGLPGETYTVGYDLSTGDNAAFRIEGNALLTTRSFDYEVQASYQLQFDLIDSAGVRTPVQLEIAIIDRTGAFDTNGPATAAVAAAYPEINVGDYVIWNATSSSGPVIYYPNSTFNVTPPNKILIKAGVYQSIKLNLSGVVGTGTANRVAITNFLGQVYTRHLGLSNGSFWRVTGQYDPVEGLGHADFPGCDGSEGGEQFGFSHGRYGIWVSNEWENESSSLIGISGLTTGWEVDHIEGSDGGFAGLSIKRDDSSSPGMDDCYLHHLYIHDTGSEGLYLGSTQPDPQHQFSNLLVERCLFLRTGTEAMQTGQLGAGTVLQNNVLWGAMDWLSPFQRYQDNVAQVGARQGGVTFRNNILMGGGEKFYNVGVSPKASITPNGQPFAFRNNLNWACRGFAGAYQTANGDNVTPWIWSGNFWGGFEFSYHVVYPTFTDSRGIILVPTLGTTVLVENSIYDSTRDRVVQKWSSGNSPITQDNNAQKTVLAPRFLNLIGTGEPLNILRWTRWTATIGEEGGFPSTSTNKGSPVTFQPGDIVQHTTAPRTRFYRALLANSQHEPPLAGDSTWELLSWTNGMRTQSIPPDDARLVPGTLYDQLGMGVSGRVVQDVNSNQLPDDWEILYEFSPSAPGPLQGGDDDFDGDGRTNYQEFLANTNPTRADQMKSVEVRIDSGTYRLDWKPPVGRAGKLQYSENFVDWYDIGPYAAYDHPSTPFSSPMALPKLFFRSRVTLESTLDLLPASAR